MASLVPQGDISAGETKEQAKEEEREVETKDLEEALAALRDPTVTKLAVSNAKFGVEGVEKIAEGLQHENCRVTDLNLSANDIGDEGVEHLVHALQHENCRVTDLELSSTSKLSWTPTLKKQIKSFLDANIKKADLQEALAALRDPTVTELDVSCAEINDEEALKIAVVLEHENCRVTELYLVYNNIGDEGVKHLSRALQHEN